MVTIVAGAVAVGIVSVCAAIPFGCIISRRMKRKAAVSIPLQVTSEPETENEESALNATESEAVQPQYHVEDTWPRNDSAGQARRVEIRVFLSSGSSRLAEVGSQGYATASGSSASSCSQQRDDSEQNTEYRRFSLQNLAAGPAAARRNRTKKSSPTAMTVTICESADQRTRNSDQPKLEITISGGLSHSIRQFREFRSDVQDSSTPKSRRTSAPPRYHLDNSERSNFWRRMSFNRNGPAKTLQTTRSDVEVIDIEIMPAAGDESRQGRNVRTDLAEEALRYGGNGSQPRGQVPGPSQENEASIRARSRWQFPSRFLDTLRETTSFATL